MVLVGLPLGYCEVLKYCQADTRRPDDHPYPHITFVAAMSHSSVVLAVPLADYSGASLHDGVFSFIVTALSISIGLTEIMQLGRNVTQSVHMSLA